MRILYHHRTRAEDAQGVHINGMVRAFRDLAHQVEVVALVGGNGLAARGLGRWAGRRPPTWLYELMSLAYNVYGYRRLCRSIAARHSDLIYERYALNTFCGILASRRFGIPLILEVNSPLAYEQARLGQLAFRRLARGTERWICSHASRTVVVSEALKRFLTANGIPDRKIVVIPNGIDPRTFHPGISGNSVRKRYRLDGKLVIGFAGWFRKWHGLHMLLDVMHEAQLAARDVSLLLVGDGPAFQELRDYAAMHKLDSNVVFTGPVAHPAVPAHIAAMDIAVQPGAPEYACPIKILEYMGMRKCIVAPDQPNIRELLEHGRTAFLFKPGDKDSLQRTLLEVLAAPARREAVGRNAYQSIISRELHWEANARRTLALSVASSLG